MTLYPAIETEIRQTEIIWKDGIKWLVINQDTWYDLSSGEWTEETAREDYQNPENAHRRAENEWSTWVD